MKAAEFPIGSGRRCPGSSPRRSTAASIIAPSAFSIEPTTKAGRRICRSESRSATTRASIWSGSTVRSATPAPTGRPRAAQRVMVPGMPSNNLDLYRFIRFVLDAGADERLSPDKLIPAMQQAGAPLGLIERQVWRYYVIPRVREGFIQRRSRLEPFLAAQAAVGARPRRHLQPLQARANADTARCHRARRAQRRQRLAVHLPAEAARGHAAALGRQQYLARRTQPLRRARRRRHAGEHRSCRHRARRGLARRVAPAEEPAPGRRGGGRARTRDLHDELRGVPRLPGQRPLRVRGRQARQGRSECDARHRSGAPRFVYRGVPQASARRALRGHTLSVQALRQDRRLRQHAARRAVAARSLSAQRFGADAARPAGAAGASGRSHSCARAT